MDGFFPSMHASDDFGQATLPSERLLEEPEVIRGQARIRLRCGLWLPFTSWSEDRLFRFWPLAINCPEMR